MGRINVANEIEDTSRYIKCMQEVRARLKLIESVTAKQLTTGQPFSDVEFVFLQLRKILELIAFASLSANKEQYSAAHAKFATHWNAKRMLADLEKVNPDFYPTPSAPPVVQPDKTKHVPAIAGGFLTKDDFVLLYDKCGEILHARNPFTDKPLTVNVLYPVTEWVSRIRTLLDLHLMHLHGGNKWIVQVPKEGKSIYGWPSLIQAGQRKSGNENAHCLKRLCWARIAEMHFLWDNREWLFSGLGVLILGGVWAFFRKRSRPESISFPSSNKASLSAEHNSSVLGSPVASGSNISQTVNFSTTNIAPPPVAHRREPTTTRPTPEEIMAQVDSVPVLQKIAAGQAYVGLKVRWPVTFSTAVELDDMHRRTERKTIIAEVDSNRFPRLRTIHKGTSMQISGTIAEFTDMGNIRLEGVDISFQDETIEE